MRQIALLALPVLMYYGIVVGRIGEYPARALLKWLLRVWPRANEYSTAELDSTVRLSLATVGQAAFLLFYLRLTDLSLLSLFNESRSIERVLYGVVLGVSEAAFASYAAYLALRIVMLVRGEAPNGTGEAWLAASRGGWIRYFLQAGRVLPTWLALLVAASYVAVEEVVFRGVIISAAGSLTPILAGCLSIYLFVQVQVFQHAELAWVDVPSGGCNRDRHHPHCHLPPCA